MAENKQLTVAIVNGALQLFGYPYSSKCLMLCSAEERNSYGTTWGWENDDRIFFLCELRKFLNANS